jgi:hypothetical protein
MNLKKTGIRLAVAAAAGALALGVSGGTANAASANISSWTSSSQCNLSSVYWMCLYYSPNHTGGFWGTTATKVATLSGTFSGGAGNGLQVRNDAASAENGAPCNIGIWVYPNYTGDSDFLNSNKGGNLGPALRNNEASIAVDDHTNCPGTGIG